SPPVPISTSSLVPGITVGCAIGASPWLGQLNQKAETQHTVSSDSIWVWKMIDRTNFRNDHGIVRHSDILIVERGDNRLAQLLGFRDCRIARPAVDLIKDFRP